MNLSEFDYNLDDSLIAQTPLDRRDSSKLLYVNKSNNVLEDKHFYDIINLINKNSVLVFNESKVIPARINFNIKTVKAEILLIKEISNNIWECMIRPGKKFTKDNILKINDELTVEILNILDGGLRLIKFNTKDLNAFLVKYGVMPTPPYVKNYKGNPDRYQNIYAKDGSSVAAPTAGFHFTKDLINKLEEKGVDTEFVNLNVGLGTFQAVSSEKIEDHNMHSESFSIKDDVLERLNKAKKSGKKIIAVGTTSVRVLESCANENGVLENKSGETNIFIYPGYKWKFVDKLITNFHIPKSTLLMLVSSLAGKDLIMKAYDHAIKNKYRFFSFGDSMFID